MKSLYVILILTFSIIGLDSCSYGSMSNNDVYELYETSNMWNFLKLDTRTGRVWSVQYSIKDKEHRFENVVNDYCLSDPTEENIGRYTLYPTKNLWNYILLDKLSGATYQLQFSIGEDVESGIVPINRYGN